VVCLRGRLFFVAVLVLTVLIGSFFLSFDLVYSQAADTIDVGQFRWTSFPLKVFVGVNEWTASAYPAAVRGAVDAWVAGISEYVSTYNDTTLSNVNYYFYLDGVNSSGSYDVTIFFNRNQISGDAVGLTTTRWNPITHEALPPIVINITTYSGTANSLFVKNVAMHEFGHALGLNHASSPTTSDGPELMYYTTHTGEIVYPSTLDVYALSWLYKGNFGETVQLPNNIPYKMLIDGNSPPPPPLTNLWDTIRRYVLITALAIVLGVAVLFAVRAGTKKEKPLERPPENEPPEPPEYRPLSINTCKQRYSGSSPALDSE